jgi:MSHA biogenesis protein MshG
MPQFAWTGRDGTQALQRGVLESMGAIQVADVLRERGITPVTIAPHVEQEEASAVLARWFKRKRVGDAEVLVFSRQMHTLSKAGVPILRALAGLQESSEHAGLKQLLGELRQSLDSGLELSQAMAKRPDVFDRFYLSMVRVGETTGQLTETFDSLYQHLDFQRFMREQVASALRYPKFVLLAMVIAVAVINLFVIPQFAKVFANVGAELPLMTRILLGTSQFTLDWWPTLLLAAGGAWLGFRSFVATQAGRLSWDRWKLHIPVAGKILRKGALSRSASSLGLVLRSGVPVLEGLRLAASVAENAHIEAAITGMRQGVERGETVLATARKAGIFTPIVLQMVMVGEESGTLDQMLDEVGQMYRREVEYELKTMSQQIEPILIFFLGAMVLVLALGVFMPMWDLGKAAIK